MNTPGDPTKGMITKLINGHEVTVDSDHLVILNAFNWRVERRGYLFYLRAHVGSHRYIYFHRFVLQARRGQVVDHINGNGLDNRRSNIRTCSTRENVRHRLRVRRDNALGATGVYRSPTPSERWYAQIKVNGKAISLGSFGSVALAKEARKAAEVLYFGEFAPSFGNEVAHG
jgi:hypothetical protein